MSKPADWNDAYVWPQPDAPAEEDEAQHYEVTGIQAVSDDHLVPHQPGETFTGVIAPTRRSLLIAGGHLRLGDGNMAFTFFQDFAAGSVDATLQPIHAGATSVALEVRATSAARSANNPAYTMTGVLPNYQPLNGDVGEASTIQATFRNASQTGIQRLTA
jgi:hypothetical protein